MTEPIDALWGEITTWLGRHAPADAARIRPPATDSQIDAVAAAVGRALPQDLRQWWRQADGAGADLIPWGLAPMSCAEALDDRAMRLEVASEVSSGLDRIDVADDERVFDFHPLFLPIAEDHRGDCLCVDLRDGPQHGCIGLWDHEGGWDGTFYWLGVTEMVTAMRDAMIAGRPVLLGPRDSAAADYRASVTPEGELLWVRER